jgi:hypothetical protein
MTVSGIGGLRQFLSDRESRQLEFKAASERGCGEKLVHLLGRAD